MEYVRSISAVTEQPFSPIFPVGRAVIVIYYRLSV